MNDFDRNERTKLIQDREELQYIADGNPGLIKQSAIDALDDALDGKKRGSIVPWICVLMMISGIAMLLWRAVNFPG